MILPDWLNIKPGRDPDVFDIERQPQRYFDHNARHDKHQINFNKHSEDANSFYSFPFQKKVYTCPYGEIPADDSAAKQQGHIIGPHPKCVRQVNIDKGHDFMRVPILPWHEQVPAGTAQEDAHDDQRDP